MPPGVLSPIMDHIVETTIQAAGFREKLTKQIERCRKRLPYLVSGYAVAETKFELAELLVSRDDPGDWKEASQHYSDVLEIAPFGYIRAAAQIGKAEVSIRGTTGKELDEAIKMAEKGRLSLKKLVEPDDFFILKAMVIEADLRAKRWTKEDAAIATRLYDQVIHNKTAHSYYRARAIVGRADLIYAFKKLVPEKELTLCNEVYTKILRDKPNDYFVVKGRVLEGELRVKRGKKEDKTRALQLYQKVVGNEAADLDLRMRAKLDWADISDRKEAIKMINEVLATKNLDIYLIDRAKRMKKALKNGKNRR